MTLSNTSYELLKSALGWNYSNTPRITDKKPILYSYKNKLVIRQDNLEQVKELKEANLISEVSTEPGKVRFAVTPAGIKVLADQFKIEVRDVSAEFKKKQEKQLAALNKKSTASTDKEETKPKKEKVKKTPVKQKGKRGRPRKVKE